MPATPIIRLNYKNILILYIMTGNYLITYPKQLNIQLSDEKTGSNLTLTDLISFLHNEVKNGINIGTNLSNRYITIPEDIKNAIVQLINKHLTKYKLDQNSSGKEISNILSNYLAISSPEVATIYGSHRALAYSIICPSFIEDIFKNEQDDKETFCNTNKQIIQNTRNRTTLISLLFSCFLTSFLLIAIGAISIVPTLCIQPVLRSIPILLNKLSISYISPMIAGCTLFGLFFSVFSFYISSLSLASLLHNNHKDKLKISKKLHEQTKGRIIDSLQSTPLALYDSRNPSNKKLLEFREVLNHIIPRKTHSYSQRPRSTVTKTLLKQKPGIS